MVATTAKNQSVIEYPCIMIISQMLHVWIIYLHWVKNGRNVGRYSHSMEHLGGPNGISPMALPWF